MRIKFSVPALALLTLSACGASGTSTSASTAAAATGLTFTGGLTGNTSATRGTGHAALCDTQPDPGVLDREFVATLGSTNYTFDIYVRTYAGPKSYPVGEAESATFNLYPATPTGPIPTGASASAGTVTIGTDTRSGDVDVDLVVGRGDQHHSTPTQLGHVMGRWTCAGTNPPGAKAPAAPPQPPLTLTGTGSKATEHFTLKQGNYKLAWSATGPSTTFIVTAHWGSNSAGVVEVPPQPPSGESLLPAPEAGDYYLVVQAPALTWTITITPL